MFFDLPLLLALAGFTYAVGGTCYLWFGLARVTQLRGVPLPPAANPSGAVATPAGVGLVFPALGAATQPPFVSVIAPACNEAAAIETAVRGFLALDWPRLEVIVVNDRSTDGTAAVLQRLVVEGDPRLHVLEVTALPAGWLGKNHANARGVAVAQGEWLLFTDADVQLHPQILAKALAHAAAAGFDHIAAAPEARLPGGVLSQFALYFALLFSVWARPWAARNPRSRAHVGIGAFNLVRRSAYERAGGHAAVRLCPDDDLELGRCVKLAGGRQDFVFANGLAAVDWYGSWGEVRRGLMKNLFAGAGYSVPLVLFGAAAQLWLLAWPVLALGLTTGLTWWLNFGLLLVLGGQGVLAARYFGGRRYGGWLLPLFAVFGSYLMLRSMALALANGGIEWRGTFYSLKELRGFPRRRN